LKFFNGAEAQSICLLLQLRIFEYENESESATLHHGYALAQDSLSLYREYNMAWGDLNWPRPVHTPGYEL